MRVTGFPLTGPRLRLTTMHTQAERARKWAYLVGYYLRSLGGDKRPLLGGVKLTHDCNLSCIHCPFWRREVSSLSFPQTIRCLKTLHDWGVRLIILEGGEPFLWRDGEHDIHDVIAEARKLFFSVNVTTNGTFPIEVESDNVWVSIDGLRDTHDLIRGRSFDRVVANIEASSHPRLYAHLTINSLNWKEVPELVEFLSLRVKGVTVQFHYPFAELDQELFLPLEERRKVLEGLMVMKQQGFPLANSYACLKALAKGQWKCHPWMIASVDPDGKLTQGCYVKGRGEVACEKCGFSVHAEISLAYRGVIEPILLGNEFFSLV